MKKIKNKGIAGILSAVLIIVGVFLIGTPSKALANENIPNVDKFLTVKWQMSNGSYELENGTAAKNLRIVTTIDAEKDVKYGKVGFYITFLADDDEKIEMHHKVSAVSHRISANSYGETYDYGPKAFHATSEWFATCTITGIPKNYWDNGIVIKPYVTVKGNSTPVYGQHRYLTMQDIEKDIITLPVEDQLTNPTVSEVDSSKVDSKYYDGYTYMRVKVDDLSKLPSISKYTVTYDGGSQEVKYRYLLASKTSDSSWYNLRDEENAAVIVNANEMRMFQKMSEDSTYNGFADKTIYLGADINLNPEWDALTNTGDKVEINPIGKSGISTTYLNLPAFAGEFDGNMHTIKGVCIRKWGSAYALGLFGEVKGATIKNFTLSNSYFYVSSSSTNSHLGSVVGILNGTLDTVKCDETVKVENANGKQYNGGMVGTSTGTSTISNCWFAGTITGTGYRLGGISGGMKEPESSCTVENCLVTGDIRAENHAGGIYGTAWTGTTLILKNSLFAGTIKNASDAAPTTSGTVIDDVSNGNPTVSNVYVRTYEGNVLTNIVGAGSAKVSTEAIKQYSTDELTGTTGYLNMNVGFYMSGINEEAKWLAVDDGHPVLASFSDKTATNIINLTKVQKVRTVWYNPTDDTKEFVLYTPADFRGFQELSKTKNFELDTIYLGADIDLNPEFDALTYSYINNKKETRPSTSNDWTPIGYSGNNVANTDTGVVASNTYQKFAGTFDGNMHSISGVFMLKWAQKDIGTMGLFGEVEGATIKNFTLKNSYCYVNIEKNKKSYTGSVVGVLNNSTLDTVKCDEDVVVEIPNATEYNGGMVGASKGTSTISNCWFAGKLSGSGVRQGGISGGMFESGSSCILQHCLVTGEIKAPSAVGGIFGTAWHSTELTLKDSLFAGKIETATGTAPETSGTLIGSVLNGDPKEVSNVYVRIDEEEVLHGTIGEGSTKVSEGTIVRLDPEELSLSAARIHANNLSICADEDYGNSEVVGKTKFWYISEKHPILASFGEPTTDYELKVATYNIRYGRHNGEEETTEKQVLEEVAKYINTSGCDVVLLQEVNGSDTIEDLRTYLPEEKYTIAYHQTVETWRGSLGIAIVSKHDIVDTQFVPIPNTNGSEARGLLKAMIDINNDDKADVAVICTHFDDQSEEDSSTGVTLLREMVDGIYSTTPNMPIVFGGDLNQAYNGTETEHIQDIDKFLISTTDGVGGLETFWHEENSKYRQLDYIFTNNHVGHGSVEVQIPTIKFEWAAEEKELSDHRPLIATLYIKAQ